MALIQYESEYSRLKKVALYRPSLAEIAQGDPNDVMYIGTPDQATVYEEFDGIVDKMQSLGIEVIVLEPKLGMTPTNNMIYLRDVAFVFRDRILIANMKHSLRQAEPQKFKALLAAYDKNYEQAYLDLDSSATMEGADIFALNNDSLVAYTGSRTSKNISSLLADYFPGVGVASIDAAINGVPQHILGGVHIIDEKTATRRIRYCQDTIEDYSYIDFEEDEETRTFSLNIVTVAPREILMPANNPKTKQKLEVHGILCHEVTVDEIHKMGGGLACMTLPLQRV